MRQPFVRSSVLVGLTAALLASAARDARAERVSDANAAEALAQAGAELMADGDVLGACRKLKQSSVLEPSAARFLALADCWERADKTASAWEAYRRAKELAASGPADLAERASAGEARLTVRLTRLEITPPSGPEFADVEIYLDGSRLSPVLYGVAVPVDPGPHELAATASARERFALELTLPSGAGTTSVRIPESSLSPRPLAPPPAPQGPKGERPSESERPGQTMRIIGLGLGGLGIAGLAAGTALSIKASSDRRDLEAACPSGMCPASAVPLVDQYRRDEAIAGATLIVGAASLVGGVVVYLLAPSGHAATSKHVAVEPLVGAGVTGLSAHGSF